MHIACRLTMAAANFSFRVPIIPRKGMPIFSDKYPERSVRFTRLACIATVFFVAPSGAADEDSRPDSAEGPGLRHRIDIGAAFFDSLSVDSLNGIAGYTYNLTDKSNVTVSIPYIDPDTGTSGDSGFGDLVVAISYAPTTTITAHPWVPRTVGTGIAVLAPTGDPVLGRSLDAWVISPFLGLVVPLSNRMFFAPQLGYLHSFGKTAGNSELRLAFAEVGFGFVAINGFWTSYFPRITRDLESDDWAVNHRFAVGKMFTQRVGLSFDYSLVERFTFGSSLPAGSGFDKLLELNAHFAF